MTVFFMKNNITFLVISRLFLLRMRNVPDKSCRENQNMHFISSNYFFFFENRSHHKTTWKMLQIRTITDENMAYVHCMLDT
jgi:hypothetical protein